MIRECKNVQGIRWHVWWCRCTKRHALCSSSFLLRFNMLSDSVVTFCNLMATHFTVSSNHIQNHRRWPHGVETRLTMWTVHTVPVQRFVILLIYLFRPSRCCINFYGRTYRVKYRRKIMTCEFEECDKHFIARFKEQRRYFLRALREGTNILSSAAIRTGYQSVNNQKTWGGNLSWFVTCLGGMSKITKGVCKNALSQSGNRSC